MEIDSRGAGEMVVLRRHQEPYRNVGARARAELTVEKVAMM